MANVIIKSDEQRQFEKQVLNSFGGNPESKEAREQAEIVARRSQEAVEQLKRMEERR